MGLHEMDEAWVLTVEIMINRPAKPTTWVMYCAARSIELG